jgi:glycosidase
LIFILGCAPPPVGRNENPTGKADGFGAPARPDFIYLAMTDRFFDGAANHGGDCFDPADPQKFHGGDFAGLRQKLDYLQELGADTLWITPAYRQASGPPGRCGYHGYWADFTDPDDAAVEENLGTPEELSGLAADLHDRGMKLVLDMVVNHAGDGARIFAEHPGWFHDATNCRTVVDCPYRAGIHDFAQEKPEVADYLTRLSAGWASRYAIDGVRMDTARYVAPDYFRSSFVPALRELRPLFLVAEVFSEEPRDLVPYLDAGFDSAFAFPLRRALVDVFAHGAQLDELAEAVATERRLYGDKLLVHFIDNHDVKRFVNEPGFGVPEDEIRRRLHLALVAIFTLPGVPQLYMGDELGLYGGDDPQNRLDMPEWAWSSRSGAHDGAVPDAQQTFALVQNLASLRPLLRHDDYRELWRPNGGADVFAFQRRDLIIALNGGDWTSGRLRMAVPLADGTVLDEVLRGGAPLTVSGGRVTVELAGKSAAIYLIRRAP